MERFLAGGLVCFAAIVTLHARAGADPAFECSIASGSQVETAQCLEETEDRVAQVLAASLRIAQARAEELDTVTERKVAAPALAASQAAWGSSGGQGPAHRARSFRARKQRKHRS